MFTKEIVEMTMSLDALNAFREYIEPLMWERVKSQYEAEARAMQALSVTFEKLQALSPDASDEEIENVKKEVKEFFDDSFEITREDDDWTLSTTGEDGDRIDNAVTNLSLINKQVDLMYKSILVNLVSNVECFLGNILRRYFALYKGEVEGKLIDSKDKIYTIHELEEFSSIEEAKEYIIDKRIEKIIRASFSEWYKFLKDKLSLKMGYMDNDYESILEIFERRNLFIHNNGIINRIYISNAPKEKQYSEKLGEHIILTKDYLEKAITILEKNFILIAYELWKNREKNDKSRTVSLKKLTHKYMGQERWDLLESATTFILKDASASDVIKKEAQINFWLAKKKLGTLNLEEVRSFDFSASTVDYRICQSALLEKYEEAIKLTERALNTDQLTVNQLYEWPVLKELRETEKFNEFVAKLGISAPRGKQQLIYPDINEMENYEEYEES